MAREKNTIPTTLPELIEALKQALDDCQENLTNFTDKDVPAGDYAKGKASLDQGHDAVLKVKDLYNGLYRFLPKAEPTGKPKEHAAITMAKEQAAKDKGAKQDKGPKLVAPKGSDTSKVSGAKVTKVGKDAAKGKPAKASKSGSSEDP